MILALLNSANEGGLAVELGPEAGWTRLAPYGDHPKAALVADPQTGRSRRETVLQRLDRGIAANLVKTWKGAGGKALKSIPIFRGHPDQGRPDAAARPVANGLPQVGTLTDFEAREDGLYGRVALSNEGHQAVVNERQRFVSIHWRLAFQHGPEGLLGLPYEIISGGLTDCPNISGATALCNEAEELPTLSIPHSPAPMNKPFSTASQWFVREAKRIADIRNCSIHDGAKLASVMSTVLHAEANSAGDLDAALNEAEAERTARKAAETAAAKIASKAHGYCATGMSWEKAWDQACAENPDLVTEMNQGNNPHWLRDGAARTR